MADPTAPPRGHQHTPIDLSQDSDDEAMEHRRMRPLDGVLATPRNAAAPHTFPLVNESIFGAEHNFNLNEFINLDNDDFSGGLQGEAEVASVERFQTTQHHGRRGEIIVIDGDDVFIPDESPEPALHPTFRDNALATNTQIPGEATTVDIVFDAYTCLQRTLAIFPDISHEYVQTLYDSFGAAESGLARFEQVIDKLLSGQEYPRQEKGRQKKRKRDDQCDQDDRRWSRSDREIRPAACKGPIVAMLKADFPEMPHRKINEELLNRTHFYHTYVALAEARDSSDGTRKWRGRPSSKNLADADTIAANSAFPTLVDELKAVRRKVNGIRMQRAIEEAKRMAEHENLERAMAAGETTECQACFDDLPMNRQVHCDGDVPHFTCFECLTTYIKSEVGQSRCEVLCTAGCGAAFAYAQLHRLDDEGLLEKLEQLQQEKAIRDAGIDDLEECPFCEYKAIMPPIEEDFEFRCANPDCERVSCRRCKAITHTPLSCEEYAKENKLNSRHKIEEAMTAALLRSCNKCKKQFIKEYGCNKMTCTSCGNLQCYVCSLSISSYDHFDHAGPRAQVRSSKCPLYDNVEERHEREVKEAEASTRRQILENNPDVSEADLEITLSSAVHKATKDNIKGANPHVDPPIPPPAVAFGGLYPVPQRARDLPELDPADHNEDGINMRVNNLAPLRQVAFARQAQIINARRRTIRRGSDRGPPSHEPLRQQPYPQQPQTQAQVQAQGPSPNAQQATVVLHNGMPVLGYPPAVLPYVQPVGDIAPPQPPGPPFPFHQEPIFGHEPADFNIFNALYQEPVAAAEAPFGFLQTMTAAPVQPPYPPIPYTGDFRLADAPQYGFQAFNQQPQHYGQQGEAAHNLPAQAGLYGQADHLPAHHIHQYNQDGGLLGPPERR